MRLPRVIGVYEPSPGPSGPSRYVDSLLSALDPAEFRPVVFGHASGPYRDRDGLELIPVCGEAPAGDARAPVRTSERPIVRPRWRRILPGFVRLWSGFSREAVHLARQFRRRRVDLLHTNNTGCEESAVAARLAGVPRVLGTFHVDSTYDLHRMRSSARYRVLECLSNHCLHRAIAVSAATKADWSRRTRLESHRIVTVHNGIDPERFRRRSAPAEARRRLGLPAEGGLVLGGVGRLDEAKGFEYLLDALGLLVAESRDVYLVLAGGGPLRERLEEQAQRLGLAERVRFAGHRRDVQEVYDALDVFVLPSLCEALGYALLEAMATGLPAVASRVDGVPEVVVHGETGVLVPPRNARALAAALRPLLDSRELRQQWGRAGRQRVCDHFNEAGMVRRTLTVYRELLRGVRR